MISSTSASTARTSKVKLLEWVSRKENETQLQSFATKISVLLNDSGIKQFNQNRENMWAQYYRIHTSSEFLSQRSLAVRQGLMATLERASPDSLLKSSFLSSHHCMSFVSQLPSNVLPILKGGRSNQPHCTVS